MKEEKNKIDLYNSLYNYWEKNIDLESFSHHFFNLYVWELDIDQYNETEQIVFKNIFKKVEVFSDYKKSSHEKKYITHISQELDQAIRNGYRSLFFNNVFDETDKVRLYHLMEFYLNGQIDIDLFSDKIYYMWNFEIDEENLSKTEKEKFSELFDVATRFSSHEEDHQLYPNVYFTIKDLDTKIRDTYQILKGQESLK